MQENKKTFKLQKVGTIALLCFLVVAFVGSIFCAMILPFANLAPEVASAYSADYQGVLEQSASGLTLRNVPTDVSSLCAIFFNVGYLPDFTDWNLPYEQVELFKATYNGDSGEDYCQGTVWRLTPTEFNSNFGVTPTSDTYFLSLESALDNYWMSVYCTDEDKVLLENAGLAVVRKPISFSYQSGIGSRIVNFTSFTVNNTYIDKLVPWVSLSCSFEASGSTTIVEEVLSPEYFATRFVTPTDSPSKTVFFNLSATPKAPTLSVFTLNTNNNFYFYDYFKRFGDDSVTFLSVSTVGWQVYPVADGFDVYLMANAKQVFYYHVSGNDFDTGSISGKKWLVASNYTFGDLLLYKYDFSGATSYFSLLPHEDGKTLPVDSQFGVDGWNSWFALFDLSNFVSLSSDVYINMGYSQAKLYYDELIKTKSQESFLQGKAIGYDLGYNEGSSTGGAYSFSNLLGAVFDAPIEAFRGLFNFEILGTNMQGFVLALLTLSVIIVVIKFALGGK